MRSSALIVGAGIGGLAAGLALKRAGWRVAIHERAASPRELGFGLLLASNALAALARLGIAGAIVEKGKEVRGVEIRKLDGRLIRRFKAQPGGPAVVALRPELHGTLLKAIGEDDLAVGSEAVSFVDHGERVTLKLANGTEQSADVLIGADGVSSVIRRQLHPAEPPPRSSGYCAVRGVAFGVSHVLGTLSAVGYLDDGIETATARASSDAVYWYVSLLTEEFQPEARTPQAVLDRLSPRAERSLAAIWSATKPDDMRFDELFRRDPLPFWGRGRVTLVGDAAHPVLPHTGQGAAQALEDAVALGEALSTPGSFQDSLRGYETTRRRRTNKFIRLGPRVAGITTTRSRTKQAIRDTTLRLLPEFLVSSR